MRGVVCGVCCGVERLVDVGVLEAGECDPCCAASCAGRVVEKAARTRLRLSLLVSPGLTHKEVPCNLRNLRTLLSRHLRYLFHLKILHQFSFFDEMSLYASTSCEPQRVFCVFFHQRHAAPTHPDGSWSEVRVLSSSWSQATNYWSGTIYRGLHFTKSEFKKPLV